MDQGDYNHRLAVDGPSSISVTISPYHVDFPVVSVSSGRFGLDQKTAEIIFFGYAVSFNGGDALPEKGLPHADKDPTGHVANELG